MTTFGDLVKRARSALRSYTGVHEQVTWLTGSADSSQTTLTVNDSSQVSVGISEVEEELIYVSSAADGILSLAPFGRGYAGSTAAAHGVNAQVTYDPTFPIVEIKAAINNVVASLYPSLYQIKSTTFTFAGNQRTYELPADADQIVRVQYELTGSSGYWPVLDSWEFRRDSEEASGRAIALHALPQQGRTVKVTYQAPLGQFADDADTMADIGLAESAVDLLIYGVTAQMIRFLEPARLQVQTVENLTRQQLTPSGDPAKIANQLYAMHLQRVGEERRKLLALDPPQIYFTR